MTDSETNPYRERAHLVAHLAAQYTSVIAYGDDPDWPVVYIDTPAGQLSWHLALSDLDLFAHVPTVAPEDYRAQWDGHDTPTKYDRLDELTAKEAAK